MNLINPLMLLEASKRFLMIMFKPGFFSALQYHKIMNIVTELHLWACMQYTHVDTICTGIVTGYLFQWKLFLFFFFFFQFLGWLLIYILFIFPNIFNVINLKHCICYWYITSYIIVYYRRKCDSVLIYCVVKVDIDYLLNMH